LPRKLFRAAASFSSVLLIMALLVVMVVWIDQTRGRHVPQLPAPEVSLTPAESALANTIPSYREAVPVLEYHGVTDTNPNQNTVSTRMFAAHLAALKKAGFTSISLNTLEDFISGRPVTLPDRPLVITVDDGEANTWSRVDPILEKYGFNAVGFIITGSVVSSNTPSYYLNESQLQSLAHTGRWEFGGHTHRLHHYQPVPGGGDGTMLDHRLLLPSGEAETHEQWAQRVDGDLAASQQFFQDKLGHRAEVFAYPFSEDGQNSNDPLIQEELPRLLTKHGYVSAFIGEHIEPPLAVLPEQARLTLPRISMRNSTTVSGLLTRVKTAIPVAMPLDPTPLTWLGQGGDCASIRNTVPVAIRVTPTKPYASCHAEANDMRWRDYRFTTDVWGSSRNTTAIVAVRFANMLDHTGRFEVALGESGAQIRQVIGQSVQPLGMIKFALRPGPVPVRHLEIAVRGSTAVVRIDDHPPLTVTLDPSVSVGGVGLSVASVPMHPVLFATPQLKPL
jgi:poly-beta-1,6-N-acetyl-D-glucosamine N-deacetylase